MTALQSLPAVFNHPETYAALVLGIVAIVLWQRTLTWPEYKRLHAVKRRVLPVVDRHTSLFVVSRKGGREDAEYVTTVEDSVRVVFDELVKSGGSPHLVNSLKVRTNPDTGNQQYSAAHIVFFHDDGAQSEVYIFATPDGGADIYCHVEPGVHTPKDHLKGEQKDGDVRGVVRDAL